MDNKHMILYVETDDGWFAQCVKCNRRSPEYRADSYFDRQDPADAAHDRAATWAKWHVTKA